MRNEQTWFAYFRFLTGVPGEMLVVWQEGLGAWPWKKQHPSSVLGTLRTVKNTYQGWSEARGQFWKSHLCGLWG